MRKLKGDIELVLYARHKATLAKWRKWVEDNGLRAKIDRLGKHSNKHNQGLAYPFLLIVSDFENIEELQEQLDQGFSWEGKEGFAKGEAGKRQEVSNGPQKKGDWLPKKSNKKRFAERQ